VHILKGHAPGIHFGFEDKEMFARIVFNFMQALLKGRYRCFFVTKGVIEYRFPERWLCHTNIFVSVSRKMRSGLEEVTQVQGLEQVAIFFDGA
jgi:hypothetical protein